MIPISGVNAVVNIADHFPGRNNVNELNDN